MTAITPNSHETGEFLHEITKDRFKNFIHISTLPDGEKIGGAYCVLHQKVVETFSKNTLRSLIDKAFTEGKGLFLNTVSTDDSGKRKGENCIDPLAIVADYDYGTEPPTDARLIELGLPIPTGRVQSGRGYHLWWFLTEESCSKEQRNKICWEIAKITGGDEQMKSDARLLRLPGSIHLKDPENPKLVYITEKNYELRYSFSDFKTFLSKLEPKSKSSSKLNSQQLPLTSNTIPPIPIERCLSKEHRELLDTGVNEGIRNQTAISLAKDLLGCTTRLEELGVAYSGDPYSLYITFCDRCSPPIPEQEREATWRSANQGAQSPSINDSDAFQNCINKWNREHGNRISTVGAPVDRQVVNTITLKDDIQAAIANLSGSDLNIERTAIAKKHGIQISAVKDIERQIQAEIDAGDTDIEELKALVDKKLAAINNDFHLLTLFPSSIATPLIEYCQGTSTPQGLMAMALITCLASLVHPKTNLICLGNTDRRAKPIFWFAIYGLSGNGKTHSYAPIISPIKNLGNSHDLIYEQKLEEWEAIQRKVKNKKPSEIDSLLEQSEETRPVRERYWVSDVTIEALIARCAKQPDRGLLRYSPELFAWCLRMDPAKGEVEYWLCLWDGESVEGDRIGREFAPVSNPSISVMGGLQPDVAAKMIAKDEEIQNGFMPRLVLVRLEEVPKPPLSRSKPINYSKLNELFKAVADTKEPMELKLSESCFIASDQWDREMDNLRLSESRKSIKPLFPKFNGYSYRIALMLHIINCALDGSQSKEVPLSTFEAAIEFTRWLLAQSISIYEELLGDSKEDAIAKFLNSAKYADWTTVRQFQKSNWRKVKTAKDARKAIDEMLKLGYIKTNGESSSKFRFRSVAAGNRGQVDKTPENLTEKAFESSTGNVDAVDNNSPTDDTAKSTDDLEDVDKFECDGNSKGFDENESPNLTSQPRNLSTTSFKEANKETATVSDDKQGEMSTASTLPVDSSNDSLKVVSSVVSTCPPISVPETNSNAECESSIVDWANIQEAAEDEF